MNAVKIPLTRGAVALIDEADAPELLRHKWYALVVEKHVYAARREQPKLILMHRQLTVAPTGMLVDHIDGDGLNNRRANLRLATQAQNLMNRTGPAAHNALGLLGVRLRYGRYEANIRSGGKQIYLGSYATAEEAVVARRAAEILYHGAFATSLCATKSERSVA